MIKILSAVVFLSSILFAQISFDEFLNNALKNSPYLKSNSLSIQQATLEGAVLQRYENPSLELEYAQFKPNVDANDNGYRVAVSQPVRLWGVGSDKEDLAKSLESKSKANYTLSHANLSKNISLLFIAYAQKKELYSLAKEELEIALRIYEISKARYEAGTISQGVMLQAKVDFEMIDINLDSLHLSSNEEYFKLLEVAGYKEKIKLNHKYDFNIQSDLEALNNPDLKYINSLNDEALATSKVNSNKLEYIDLLAEFENEPDQDIFRVGVSIPLAIFNTKKEEMQIAKLESNKAKLIAKKQTDKITLSMLKLSEQRGLLIGLQAKNSRTLATQEKLLTMFEESYKIANVNLLELQNIKNRVIETKESLIKIKFALDVNTINTNYIAGAYNE